MPPVGFEPTISAGEGPQTYALDRAATGTGNNKHLFDTNNEIHNYKFRSNNNLRLPLANLSKFSEGAYISGIKVSNHLPQYIKALINNHISNPH